MTAAEASAWAAWEGVPHLWERLEPTATRSTAWLRAADGVYLVLTDDGWLRAYNYLGTRKIGLRVRSREEGLALGEQIARRLAHLRRSPFPSARPARTASPATAAERS